MEIPAMPRVARPSWARYRFSICGPQKFPEKENPHTAVAVAETPMFRM